MKKGFQLILGFVVMLLGASLFAGVTGEIINNLFMCVAESISNVSFPTMFLQENVMGLGFTANLFVLAYVNVDVSKPLSWNAGAGGDKKDYILLFDMDDVVNMPQRDAKGVLQLGDIIFKPGAYMIKIYATRETIKVSSASEGDTDAMGIMQTLEFSHPGSSLEIKEFRANWLNRNAGAIIVRCSSNRRELLGGQCAPLKMSFAAEDSNEKNATVFTFTSSLKGPEIADYQGSLTFADVVAIVAADSTSIELTEDGEYQLSDNSMATEIVEATGATDGMIFTLLGSGGNNPATIVQDGGDFVLKDGLMWTGIAGSRITFKAYKTGDTSFCFIEMSRA